jgi:hypothetical protein
VKSSQIFPVWSPLSYVHSAEYRQSARLFLQSSEFGPPPPHPHRSVYPLGFRGERHTLLLAEEGVGVPHSDEGQTLLYSRYKCTLWFTVFEFSSVRNIYVLL